MVGLFSEDDLKIDGALIAQNEKVGRFSYGGTCAEKTFNCHTLRNDCIL